MVYISSDDFSCAVQPELAFLCHFRDTNTTSGQAPVTVMASYNETLRSFQCASPGEFWRLLLRRLSNPDWFVQPGQARQK